MSALLFKQSFPAISKSLTYNPRFLLTLPCALLPQQLTQRLQSEPIRRTMSTNAAEQTSFIDAVKSRRTYYQLTNESTIPDSRIEELVRDAILHCPSSFNSQSTRLVVLLKKEHEQLWDMVRDVLKAMVPEENFKTTQQKLFGFRGGYGTVCICPVTGLGLQRTCQLM